MIVKSVELETVCGITSKIPDNVLPEIAFAGKSNVGKSSLINGLVNRKALARTSSSPGKTQTINFYNVNRELYFVDLPGYGYAKVSKSEKIRWAEMLEGYFKTGRNIRLVVQLIDMRHKPSADDLMMIDFLRSTGYPFVIVMTKSDKLNKTQFAERSAAIYDEIPDSENVTIIPFSATNGLGREEITEYINNAL